MTKTLVVGATGATGRMVVTHLLNRGRSVKVIVRSAARMPEDVLGSSRLEVVEAPILGLSEGDLDQQVAGCTAVVSCLGHNVSIRGIFLPPRRLVTDATRRLCAAIRRTEDPRFARFVLMSSVAVVNPDADERLPSSERFVLGLLQALLAPHADNVEAAEYLRSRIGPGDGSLQWVAVRPASLIDDSRVSKYDVHPALLSGPIFGEGSTSRINVGHFISDLVTEDDAWVRWKGQMPAIYNRKARSAERPGENG